MSQWGKKKSFPLSSTTSVKNLSIATFFITFCTGSASRVLLSTVLHCRLSSCLLRWGPHHLRMKMMRWTPADPLASTEASKSLREGFYSPPNPCKHFLKSKVSHLAEICVYEDTDPELTCLMALCVTTTPLVSRWFGAPIPQDVESVQTIMGYEWGSWA